MIISREEINTDNLLYNPFHHKSINRLRKEHKEFSAALKELDFDKIIAYVILYYDFNSDLKVAYKDYQRRKRVCMQLAGYELEANGKRFNKFVEDVMLGNNKYVNKMIIRYVSLFGKPEYIMYHSYNQLFYQIHAQIIDGVIDNPSKLIEASEKLKLKINELEGVLFGGKESLDLRAELYKDIDSKRLIQPEDIVKQLNKGENIFEDGEAPYGEDYMVEDSKFIGDE